ncbi:unnamed protein product [Paramecium pentaurelia]|uniref:Uncharacterized protein n=1 Tax=Paramecium pentaurelia TaxID=43138 RepID=A0A8S1WVR0_9CILI|nr:unnamed protein product [Paramecium pentaurelia]
MSLNIYNEEEEQRFTSDYQIDCYERDYPQTMDENYTINQSPLQSKQSFKKAKTGQNKHIRKIKQLKKLKKISQYDKEWINYMIQRASQMEEEGLFENLEIDLSQKEFQKILRKMKRLDLN